jgi:hypothetical protein
VTLSEVKKSWELFMKLLLIMFLCVLSGHRRLASLAHVSDSKTPSRGWREGATTDSDPLTLSSSSAAVGIGTRLRVAAVSSSRSLHRSG